MKLYDPKPLGDFLNRKIAEADEIRPEDVTMEYIIEQRRARESEDTFWPDLERRNRESMMALNLAA